MILTVTAGKGGVGKSTVSYNLAALLDAVVVDGDLGMADLPHSSGPDLHDVLAGRADPTEAVRENGPVTILPCGRSLAGIRAGTPSALVEAVAAVRRQYGRVVIDSPAGMRSDAGLPLFAADACLLVTRPTTSAVADAVRARELAREIGTPLTRVALNRVDPERLNRPSRDEQLATRLGAPVVPVPESTAVERAQGHGLPVARFDPDCLAAERFRTLASAIERTVRGGL